MNLYDQLRAAIDEDEAAIGRKRSAVLVGSRFALALLDQMEREEELIRQGKPRNSEAILAASFQSSKENKNQYETEFHEVFDLLDECVVRQGVKSYNSVMQWKDHNWALPIVQGVITNFVWLLVCMLLIWAAFAIKQDWPAVVQSWFV